MDKQEALAALERQLAEYRKLGYTELAARIGEDEQCEVTGPSGAEYQIEVQFLWDGKPDGDIRVFGGIDDGTLLAAFRPVCNSFVMTPDGRFLCEARYGKPVIQRVFEIE